MRSTSSRAMEQAAQHSGVRASSVEVPSGTGSGLHSYCDLIAPAFPLTWCTELVLEGITLPEGAVVTALSHEQDAALAPLSGEGQPPGSTVCLERQPGFRAEAVNRGPSDAQPLTRRPSVTGGSRKSPMISTMTSLRTAPCPTGQRQGSGFSSVAMTTGWTTLRFVASWTRRHRIGAACPRHAWGH